MKISICRICYHFYPEIGGSINHIIELTEQMSKFTRQQFIITHRYKKVDYTKNPLNSIGNVTIYPEKTVDSIPLVTLRAIFCIPSIVLKTYIINKNDHFDVIQSHDLISHIASLIAGKILNKPVFWMIHGDYSLTIGYMKILEPFYLRLFSNKFLCPTHIFVLDDGSLSFFKFKSKFGIEKVTKVYHGIDTFKYKREKSNIEIAKQINVTNKFLIISTSELGGSKNTEYSIIGFKRFIEKYKVRDAQLILLGGSENKNLMIFTKLISTYDLEDTVKILPRVPRDEVINYLSISDVYISTSMHSNINRATFEAMSCELSSLVFDNGIEKNVFKQMVDCILVQAGNVEEFSDKLYLLYTNNILRTSIGKNARIFVEQNRSWTKRIEAEMQTYSKYVDLYE